ncbi:thiamine ABC transporter substrate-binding protein [Nitriliruptor alkaliphilus]|uniref:thiamine ABC transporter substrate-binding protein n=1 Tax=Nitriliruptor alkaliphilus TaxID=427918 RepID=UPI0006976CBB|nr:thiamine ABC transporter substrate-binding protein [Nitriliruptor alkaliphilus]
MTPYRTHHRTDHRLRPRARRVVSLLATVSLLAACGVDPDEDAPADDPPVVEDGEVDADDPEATAEPVTIRLLTHDSFDVSDEVLAGFTEDTGIDVELVPSGDAGEALNQAILTRDNPQGDLLFGVDTTFLSRALDEDIFLPYASPELDRVPAEFLPGDDRVTPVDAGDVCLNYDVAYFEEDTDLDVPASLDDLIDPAYAGLTVAMNPATSSPGLAFVLATVQEYGDEGWLPYWEALRDNDVLITDGWSTAYYDEFSGSGQGGDRPIVVSYASSPAAEVVFADPPTDTPPTGVVQASCVRQIEYVGILQGTEHEAEARQLVDFMLSREFQEDVPLTMFVYPVVEDAQLPDVFAEHAQLAEEPYAVDPLTIGGERETWIEEWTDTVLR